MQQKRNIALVISLLLLMALTLAVYFLQQRETRAAVDPGLFKLTDSNNTNRIIITSHHKTVDLKYNGSTWMINQKYEADPQLIKVLIATLLQITPQRPVALQQRDSVARWLARDGAEVQIFEGDVKQRQFVAGGNPAKTSAYFSGDDHLAYLMTIPGYRVYASGIFELKENEWREKRIFNFNWRNFKRLTLKMAKEPAADFEIARQGEFLGVVGLENPDSTRINTFLSDVLTLSADQIVPAGSSGNYDSLVKTAPMFTLSVLDITGKTYQLQLFAPLPGDNMVVGKGLEDEVVLFERRKTYSILKKRDYFKAK
jgi:Domain of unknown function (DUF4340)